MVFLEKKMKDLSPRVFFFFWFCSFEQLFPLYETCVEVWEKLSDVAASEFRPEMTKKQEFYSHV